MHRKETVQFAIGAKFFGMTPGQRARPGQSAELGVIIVTPIEVVTDNDATRLSVRNPGATARTRHYEGWMQYCRELQLKKVINMIFARTTEMIADIFTKALDKTTFIKFRDLMVQDVRA